MRGATVPFAVSSDVSQVAGQLRIPQAFTNGTIDAAWVSLSLPAGSVAPYGFIESPLPALPSNLQGVLGYDPSRDQVGVWTGSDWRYFA